MDPDERLTALKKGYADIILNTAKEAAARIMVSERKALRFQQELCVAKEMAVQMLLRLKKVMDSKISEAEMTSLNQQKKTEELEAQLQEAEDIVHDLREELREVHAELGRVRRHKQPHLEKQDTMTLHVTLEENSPYLSQSVLYPPLLVHHEFVSASHVQCSNLNQEIEVHKCNSGTTHLGSSYLGNPEIPSIILRSKEPDLYRNGCTQRIQACERNLSNGELPLPGLQNDAKHEISSKEDERICSKLPHEVYKKCAVETKVGSADASLAIFLARRIRRKAASLKIKKAHHCRKFSNQSTKSNQAPDIPLERTHVNSVKDCCAEIEMKDSKLLMDKFEVTERESDSAENSEVPDCAEELDKDNLPSVDIEKSEASDTTSGAPCQHLIDRIIKYTFQRKRKRETLGISDESESPVKSTTRSVEEKQNNSFDPHKSSLSTEPSRRSCRLEQLCGIKSGGTEAGCSLRSNHAAAEFEGRSEA